MLLCSSSCSLWINLQNKWYIICNTETWDVTPFSLRQSHLKLLLHLAFLYHELAKRIFYIEHVSFFSNLIFRSQEIISKSFTAIDTRWGGRTCGNHMQSTKWCAKAENSMVSTSLSRLLLYIAIWGWFLRFAFISGWKMDHPWYKTHR